MLTIEKYRMEKAASATAGAQASCCGSGLPASSGAFLWALQRMPKCIRARIWLRVFIAVAFALSSATLSTFVYAIDPNTPITNTATASYSTGGSSVQASASATIVSDPGAGNSPPTGLSLIDYLVPENGDGIVVGTLDALDSDSADTHTFAVTDPRFVVIGDSLQLAPGTAFNFELDTPIPLDVSVTDDAGENVVISITVTIVDVNEAPDSITLAASSIPPSTPGATIGPVTVTDPDFVDSHSFTVDDTRFIFVGNELRLAPDQEVRPGPPIVLLITATDKGGLTITTPFTLQVGQTPNSATIDFFAPDLIGGSSQTVSLASCSDNASADGKFSSLPATTAADGTTLLFPLTTNFSLTNVYRSDGTAFFRVRDAAANADSAAIDTLFVRLDGSGGDTETLAIAETGVDTGEFYGYVQTVALASAPGNCELFVASNERLVATYTNALDGRISASTAAVINPHSRIFDAANGVLIDGATITLINSSTGAPAAVFGDDGVSVFPSTIVSGQPVTDAKGTLYNFGPGEFRFPVLVAGNYRYEIVPPGRYVFPSIVADNALQALPGAPFTLETGSRGGDLGVKQEGVFVVDVPLDLALIPPTPAEGRLHRGTPGVPGDLLLSEPVGICLANGSETLLSAPLDVAGNAFPVNDLVLSQNTLFTAGETLFVEIADADQDINPQVRDTVRVSLTAADGADQETIVLTETEVSSGVFAGYIGSVDGASAPGDCLIGSPNGAEIEFAYVDPNDADDRVTLVGGLNFVGLVFNAVDGSLVDGARITLVDSVTGLPANVLAADGVTGFPATVESGGNAIDEAGNITAFALGQFSFPRVAPGTYRLLVEPPLGLGFPSIATNDELALFFTGPYERGESFTIASLRSVGGTVPLDVLDAQVFVEKIASRDTVAVGDVVGYRLNINNPERGTLSELVLHDQLPPGFRLVEDSLRFDGAVPAGSPVTFDATGRSLEVALPDIGALGVLGVSYVVEVTPGAEEGRAVNNAWVSGRGVASSNRARAIVFVQDDLLRNKGTIIGEVLAGACNEPGEPVSGVRVLLEDGTFVLTDEQGRYHVEGLRPGVHVVQMEVSTLPRDLEPLACERNNRFGESTTSQFVELQGGSLWRADFRVHAPDVARGPLQGRLLARYKDGEMQYRYLLQGDAPQPLRGFRLEVLLPKGLEYARGRATFGGKPTQGTGPDKDGLVFFELDLPEGKFSEQVVFRARLVGEEQRYSTRASARFRMDDNAHALPQVVASVNTAAPSSLNVTGFSDSTRVRDEELASPSEKTADKRGIIWQETEDVLTPEERAQRRREFGVPPIASTNSSKRADKWEASASQGAQKIGRGDEADLVMRVQEPGSGSITASSDVAIVHLTGERTIHSPVPDVLPDVVPDPRPKFGVDWLTYQNDAAEFVWPLADSNPANPAIAVAVKHRAGWRPNLLVNGDLVDPLTFDSVTVHRDNGNAVTLWKNVIVNGGRNILSAQFETGGDDAGEPITRVVWLSGVPVRAELALDSSNLVADGITPPVLAVRLFDREGRPARPGMTGEYNLAAPYRALEENKALAQLSESSRQGSQRYIVRNDGVAYISLEPTTRADEVQLYFSFDRNRQRNIRARLKPVAREWVLVGLAEGTVGYEALAPHAQPVDGQAPEDVVTDGRLSFYAKGQIRGEWLLTLGYDSDRSDDLSFRQQIDPNRFYTLYGDGAEQAFDNETSRQLYVKLERDVAALLLGDFDTEMSRGELTRYSRRLNGVKADYYKGNWKASAFGANTDQGFLLDTIAGDGTSGVYRLSRGGLVRNGERVRIVVRDRFAIDQVLNTTNLTRFVDYSIDYTAGTLIFKRPIESQDSEFNPQFIEVEYEIDGRQDEIVAGGRVAFAPGLDNNEIGISYVEDSTPGVGGSLAGLDAQWELNDSYRLEVEAASTDSDLLGRGEAYRAELMHESERLAGRVFYREQDANFGLGQQSALTTGLRRFGVEGEFRVRNELTLRAEVSRQQDLGSGGERDVYGAEARYRLNTTELLLGARKVDEVAASGRELHSEQLLAAITQPLFEGRVQLRGNAEIGLGGGDDASDFPTRVIGGVDYRLPRGITLFAEQEFTWGSDRDSQDTRAGIRAQPWIGADLHTRVDRQITENAERLFSTSGVLQQFRVSEDWLVDVGLDRVNTLNEIGLADDPDGLIFAPQLPAASGSFNNRNSTLNTSINGLQLNEDFTAAFVGLGFRREQWDASARIEYHNGDLSTKGNLLLGVSHQLRDGNIFSVSGSILDEDFKTGADRRTTDLRLGVAWRPVHSRWTVLNRLDLRREDVLDASFDTRSQKIVHNMNINYKRDPFARRGELIDATEEARRGFEMSFNFGAKYVRDRIGDAHFGGFTGLLGLAARLDLNERWTIGTQGSATYAASSDVANFSAGLSVSRSLRRDMWVRLGYNVTGFVDDDFEAADYTRHGPFLQFRLKLDRDSVRRFVERLPGIGSRHRRDAGEGPEGPEGIDMAQFGGWE